MTKPRKGARLLNQANQEAQKVLEACSGSLGLRASGKLRSRQSVRTYEEVWARDSMIALLGGSLVQNKKIHHALRRSLETLRSYQTDLGYIPINVEPKTNKTETMNAGSVDANSWYIVGHYVYWQAFRDKAFLQQSYPSILAAMTWLRYQDSDNCGLIEMQEAAVWADMFAVRGTGLYSNALYYKALDAVGEFATLLGEKKQGKFYQGMAMSVKRCINERFWTEFEGPDWDNMKPIEIRAEWQVAHSKARLDARDLPYYLPYLTFRDFGTWCDSFGNLLAILFGIADEERADHILTYFSQTAMDYPYPVKAIYPSLHPGDKDWRDYYAIDALNFPDHYINGGIWPFIGGFYVAALVRAKRWKEAEEQLVKLAAANQLAVTGEWGFHEWLHGTSGRPNGAPNQAWSAAMYLYAHHAVKTRQAPYF